MIMKKYFTTILLSIIYLSALSQEQTIKTELNKYKEYNGEIVIDVFIDGHPKLFLLDLAGSNSIIPEYSKKGELQNDTIKKISNLYTVSFGNNVFVRDIKFSLLGEDEAEKLRNAGISGTINSEIFRNVILTIDKRGKRIITSIPHKPKFINIADRADCNIDKNFSVQFEVFIDGLPQKVFLDTRSKCIVDISSKKHNSNSSLTFINVSINKAFSDKNLFSNLKESRNSNIVGLGFLEYGIISIDYIRSKIYFQSYEKTTIDERSNNKLKELKPGSLNEISKDEFLEYIYDYKQNKEFIFKGEKPAVIDFWATWCGPCMKMIPEMERISANYKDRIVFYKVNADVERELCEIFGIKGLPTLLFIPVGGKPIREIGAQPEKYIQIIDNMLKK